VEVGVGAFSHVVVDHDVDSFNIDTSAKQIGGNQNSRLEFLEELVSVDSVKKVKQGA
jgi:hypothetical protein